MPELHFTIDTGSFVRNLVGQFRAMRDAALDAIDQGADVMIEMMQDRIKDNDPGDYKMYYFRTREGKKQLHFPLTSKKKNFGTYWSSSPGDPPAILSGRLLKGFRKRVFFSRGHTRVIAEIYNVMSYAYYLEYGAVVGGKGGFPRSYMEPRPFMAPVIFSPAANHRMLLLVRAAMERAGQAHGAR